MENKDDGTWSFVNVTKGHICPCRFASPEDAVKDMDKRAEDGRILAYERVKGKQKGWQHCCRSFAY